MEGVKGLTETENKKLLLHALWTMSINDYLVVYHRRNRTICLVELVQHLKKQFHDNKTLFQHRFKALNFRASPPATAIEILDKVNVLEDAFELDNFNIDQLKILLTALVLSDHTYYKANSPFQGYIRKKRTAHLKRH